MEVSRSLFRQALRIRLVEERVREIYPSDRIQSPVHLSNGQEAISVGVCDALARSDLVFGTYRSHALYLAKGGDLDRMFAELYGRSTGCGGGKAGSMHLCAPEVGMMGASAIVATTIPHAVGAALAARIRGTGQVVACFFGEGATGEGVYHESLNLAAVHQVPLLLVCEHNDLAINTRVSEVHAFEVAAHAEVFGIPATTLERGSDVDFVAAAAHHEVEATRAGSGPRLLQIRTFRALQHVGPDADFGPGLRPLRELEDWEATDPLTWRRDWVEALTPELEAEIDAAVAFAEASPFPGADALLSDVVAP